jgi:hypothetical protein
MVSCNCHVWYQPAAVLVPSAAVTDKNCQFELAGARTVAPAPCANSVQIQLPRVASEEELKTIT